jgi:Tol biopolymer transport system component
MLRACVLALAGMCAALLFIPASFGGASEPVPPSAQFVYSLTQNRNGWLEVADLAGGQPRVLTPKPAWYEPPRKDYGAVWSHDGSRIAFVRAGSRAVGPGIYVVNRDRSGLRRVVPLRPRVAKVVYLPGWSPDGTRLAFERFGTQQCSAQHPVDLRFTITNVADRTSTTVRALPKPAKLVELGQIQWSPDGSRLLYTVVYLDNAGDDPTECRWHHPDAALFTVDSDGRNRRSLGEGYVYGAAWSPDSKWIAAKICEDNCDLWVVAADGTGSREVTTDVWNDFAWLANGTEMAIADPDGLDVVDVTSGERRVVAEWPAHDSESAQILGVSDHDPIVAVESGWDFDDDFNVKQTEISLVSLDSGSVRKILVPSRERRANLWDFDLYLP